ELDQTKQPGHQKAGDGEAGRFARGSRNHRRNPFVSRLAPPRWGLAEWVCECILARPRRLVNKRASSGDAVAATVGRRRAGVWLFRRGRCPDGSAERGESACRASPIPTVPDGVRRADRRLKATTWADDD